MKRRNDESLLIDSTCKAYKVFFILFKENNHLWTNLSIYPYMRPSSIVLIRISHSANSPRRKMSYQHCSIGRDKESIRYSTSGITLGL